MKKRVLGSCLIGAVFAGLCLVPPDAVAGVRVVTPERFRLSNPSETVFVNPAYAISGASANFWAPVKLPVGARVTKLELLTWGGSGASALASLDRVKVGAPITASGADTLMIVSNTTETNYDQPPHAESATTPAYPSSDLVVRRGYRYYLSLQSFSGATSIHAVKVYFRK